MRFVQSEIAGLANRKAGALGIFARRACNLAALMLQIAVVICAVAILSR